MFLSFTTTAPTCLRRQVERSRPLIDALEKLGERYDATIAQVALNWVIHCQGNTVVAIPGASRPEQIEEAAGAMRFQLADSEQQQLEQLSRNGGGTPGKPPRP